MAPTSHSDPSWRFAAPRGSAKRSAARPPPVTKFWGDHPRYLRHPELNRAPELLRTVWQSGSFSWDWSPADFERGRRLWPKLAELTRRLHAGGVTITAGSDTPNPWVIPGVSLHEGLQPLHEAGLTPLEVIRAATSNAARALGLEDEIGAVAVGLQADLVVLAADPLDDLSNTRAIAAVLQGGRLVIEKTAAPQTADPPG